MRYRVDSSASGGGNGRRRPFGVRLAAVAASLALFAAACGGDDGEDSSDTTAASTTTAAATTTTAAATTTTAAMPADLDFVVGIGQDLPNLDGRLPGGSAAAFSALRHITEPLVFFDAVGEYVPKLATEWERVDDLTWRFTLREGVTFHNGEPWNAEAAKFSIDQAINPDLKVWHRFATGSVLAAANVVDEFTVDIVTKTPNDNLPNILTAVDMVPPKHVGADQANQNTKPIGTGPFTFVSFTPRSELVLERNEDWWGDTPDIKNLTFRIIPERATRVAALEAGEVQVINSLAPEDLTRLKSAGAKIESSATTRTIMIALRSDRGPLQNPKIRQAMNYAVNKEEIVAALLSGIAEPLAGPLSPTLPGALTNLGPYPYDPEKAKALLAEAGYAGEPITIAVGAGRYPNDDQVGLAVVDQLQKVGLKINFVATDFASQTAEVNKKADMTYDAWYQGWGASLRIGAEVLNAFFGGPNASLPLFYTNPAFTTAFEAYRAAKDDAAKTKALQEAQKIVWEDAGGLFLYVPTENLGMQADVEGVPARFDEFFFVDQATIAG
jgi:peptide/nickel transport system substrate-binding protein